MFQHTNWKQEYFIKKKGRGVLEVSQYIDLNVEVRNSPTLSYIIHNCPWMVQMKADKAQMNFSVTFLKR